MDSCDTLAIYKTITVHGENILAKNSDRPHGEAQPLTFCQRTEDKYAVLGSRPYWIQGFEMGANEKGLFIGNEAEGSRCPDTEEEGMLGMDMLRTALEKAADCREAIDVIAGLLDKYGQNANAHPVSDRRYENAFILVDPSEIWVMETAGRHWAAKQIKDYAAESNCYSIEDDYDLCSADMEKTVRQMRYLRPDETVKFARAFTAPADRQRNSVTRMRRLKKLMDERKGPVDAALLKRVFRDHFEGEIIEPRYGACYGGFVSICMHALTEGLDSSQTAASMLMTYDDALGLKFMWAPAVPCLSVYIPLYWVKPEERDMKLPSAMTKGGVSYEAGSLWWAVDRLATLVSMDEETFGDTVRENLKELEAYFEESRSRAEEDAREAMRCGDTDEACRILDELTEECVTSFHQTALLIGNDIAEEIRTFGGAYGPRKERVEEYAGRVGMSISNL